MYTYLGVHSSWFVTRPISAADPSYMADYIADYADYTMTCTTRNHMAISQCGCDDTTSTPTRAPQQHC